jgi:4-amino-4-deoxy-L-arabinose transferase-like glycosyltransferase
MQRTLTPSVIVARRPLADRRAYVALLSLGLLALALLLINLAYAPAPWFDEGSHLHVPQTLVTHGVYADISSEGFRYFGPTIGVGPTVMLPIAVGFKLFGVSILAGRLVIVAYALLALAVAALLARRLHGLAAAPLTIALLLASRTLHHPGLVEYGRQVLGEVPGVAFLLLGCLAWQAAINAQCTMHNAKSLALAMEHFCMLHVACCILSGLCFGLALITKNQFALVVGPGLGLIALLDWAYYRQGGRAPRATAGKA